VRRKIISEERGVLEGSQKPEENTRCRLMWTMRERDFKRRRMELIMRDKQVQILRYQLTHYIVYFLKAASPTKIKQAQTIQTRQDPIANSKKYEAGEHCQQRHGGRRPSLLYLLYLWPQFRCRPWLLY
jgi:hypothetical protein